MIDSKNFKLSVVILATLSMISLTLLVVRPAHALPLPKVLIEEVRPGRDTKLVSFHEINDKAPKGARHLIVEVYTATSGGLADNIPVQLVFNYGEAGSYVNRHLAAEAEQLKTNLSKTAQSAEIMNLPVRMDPKFGSSRAFIPWAFLSNQTKHVLSQSGVGGDYVASSVSHWDSLSPIQSIDLKLEGDYKFEEGSLIQVYAVDERYRISEQILSSKRPQVDFPRLPRDKEGLIVIGQTRASEINPFRRGDRVWYSVNDDTQSENYQVQRLTGEAPVYSPISLGSDKLLLDQIREPRIGWNTAAEAPDGVFGPWLVYLPEYENSNFWRSFISLHGTHDSHYDPVGNELGRWKSTDNIKRLSFFPQSSRGFEEGSRIGVYGIRKSDTRYEVEGGGQSEVRLDIPAGYDGVELQISARSLTEGLDDELVVEFNGGSDAASYLSQSMWALDGSGGAISGPSSLIGAIPAKGQSSELFSNLAGSMKGLSGDVEATLQVYGGIPAEGTFSSTAISSLDTERIVSVTFKTKSGDRLAPGSVFLLWVEDPYLNRDESDQLIEGVNARAVLLVFVLSLGAIALIISQLRQRK